MKIKELDKKPGINQNKQLFIAYNQFNQILTELAKKELTEVLVIIINNEIDKINAVPDSDKKLRKQLRISQSSILNKIEEELKLVTKNHYRSRWLVLGMTIFGVPMGVAFGTALGNMAFLGIGLPIGMAVGMLIGSNMDKKALEEGRQLDLEIKY